MMKVNKWTLGLAAVGLVTLPTMAEEKLSALQTALSSTTIAGYVDTSAHWQLGTGGTIPNQENAAALPPAYAFNTPTKQDGFNLNVVNLVIEKPLDPQDNWAAGYKIDMIYGPNAVGWNNSVNGDSTSDFGLKQAYVALRAPIGNGLDLKMGTFDTIIGYEVFNAGSNPNYTRSWGYTIEPTQHTGLLASYQFSKEFGIAGGVANTQNAGINRRSPRAETDKAYMGAVTLTAPDSMGFLAGSTLYGGIVSGFNTGISDDVNNFYGGVTVNTPMKQLKVGASYDYMTTTGYTGMGGAGDASYANAIGLYGSFQATEKLSFHARAERASGSHNSDVGLASYTLTGGTQALGTVFAVTGTVQYDLWANVLSRVEFRWDHAEHGAPFNNSDEDAFLLAANLIYKF